MKTFTFRSLFLIGFIFLFLSATKAQKINNNYDLLLKIGNVNVAENTDEYIFDFKLSDQKIIDGYFYKIIQFYEIPSSSQIQTLQERGLRFLEYIPNKAYIVAIPAYFNLNELRNYNVRNFSDIVDEYKQDLYLLDKNYPEWALRGENQIDLIVSYYRNIPFDNTTMELSPMVSNVIQNDPLSNAQILRVSIDDIDEIIAFPQVYFVEAVYAEGEPENYTGKTLHRSNVLDSKYETGRHYDGTDVNVMLQDDGIIGPHIDYEGRIGAQYLTSNSGDHGDHCAGIIFGSGNIDPTAAGMAPGAELFVWSASDYPGFNSMETAYPETGIRISSTSYGNGCNAGYTSLARTMDIQINTYESLMHVFSTGNSGTQNCGYGAGSGWGNITGGHKVGKNVIATGNLNSTGQLSGSSSRGPAHDGRIKPDISAKGSSVYSTIDPHDYASKSGTSMACPGIAGSLAQLYQAYKELNEGDEPPGGLMKALILNTADDLGNPGPDFMHGWGQINNLRAVETLEEERYMIDEINQGESNSHTITVPDGVKEMKVMVYWTDKEASVNTSKALINDLDITVTDPSSIDHLPWVLNHFPSPDSLNKPAIKGQDALNNMEQVQIDDPESGSYTLNVEGTEIPFGPQEYYVLYQFIYDNISVTYPLGGESFKPSETVMVRWDAYGDNDPFTLEYSLDNGSNWIIVSETIFGEQRHYNWTTPSEITGSAKVRISRNGQESTSEDVFSIMLVPENISVERACEESVLLTWDTVANALTYDVYVLGEKYMEIVGSTSDDSLFVDDISSEEEYWFSVRAIGADNAIGRRANAIMKSPGQWNCLITKDISLSEIISPPMGVLFDCQDYSDLNVQLEITNAAIVDVSDIIIHYEFNGAAVVSETYTGTLVAGDTLVFEFTSTVSLPSNGAYEMTAWIESPGDQNEDNDIIVGIADVKSSQFLNNNIVIDFDEYADCSGASDCEDVFCYLDEKYVNMQNGLNDDIDWRVFSGLTPTPYTGPLGDHTTGTASGKYLYLEASGDCEFRKAILTTPCADLTNSSSPILSFWYNMNGTDMGSLHVDVVSDGILHKDIMDPISGNLGYEWYQGQADLLQFASKNVTIRFRGYTGSGELSDMAIDDIMVTELTNVNEVSLEESFHISPNPSTGNYNLVLKKSVDSELNIRIVDITGRTIIDHKVNGIQANTTFPIDISNYDNGIYFLIIETNNQQFKEKLLKY